MNELKIRREPLSRAINRLEKKISQFEKRYERSSAAMLKDIRAGKARETAEIAQWLTSYHVLQNLRAHGHTNGTAMRITKQST